MKILDIASLEKNFLDKVFDLTATISNDWPNVEQIGAGKTICLLFWEPSTRTKLSFEHAAKKLGFNVLDFSPENSSVKKGESLEDTILTLLAMQVDGFIIRHPEDHISKTISSMLPDNVFYINAGDGNHAHPTQAMLDVFTMKEKFNDIEIQTTFQSRFGPQEWLTPYTDKTLEDLPKKGIKNLLVICPGFASDCVETLEEINIQGRESFLEKGGENFDLIPCLNDNSDHIRLFESLIKKYL